MLVLSVFSWSFNGAPWLIVEERLVWGGDELIPYESVLFTGQEKVFVLGSGESGWGVEVSFEAVIWEENRLDA